jgi:hypothetical protein
MSVESKDLQVLKSGERTNAAGKPVSNIILLSTSDSDYRSLRPHLEYVNLPNHLVLHEAGGKLEFAYFPNRGLISLVVVMKDGKTAEAGIVGNEGFSGTPAAVGLSMSPLRAVVQIAGDGFRVEVGALQNTLESAPRLQWMLNRYAVVLGIGTDRPTVSLAAGVLQKKKLIKYTRGAVKIVNRRKLEDSACECYGVIQQYDGELTRLK